MDILGYLDKYKDTSFKEASFNEVDALALALFAYLPFEDFKLEKEKFSREELSKKINEYHFKKDDGQRIKNTFKLAKIICEGARYNKATFAHFKKINDKEKEKQFQAITILFKDFIYVSFCGTDSTVVGWKEDVNMAILEVVPSEIEAIKYANMVAEKHWFRKLILGGHSKGARLSITAAKGLNNKKRLQAVFSFDGPNFPAVCYNEDYKKIDSRVLSYAPSESIIGRLMNEYRPKIIVKSTNKFIFQHDAFSWLINDKCFTYDEEYTVASNNAANAINNVLINYDDEKKHQVIDAIFDIADRLNFEKLPSEDAFKASLSKNWPIIAADFLINTPKNEKRLALKIAFDILKDYFITPLFKD